MVSNLLIKVGKISLKVLRFWRSRTSVLTGGPIGKYYKGGFEPNMSKREAYLILGLSTRAREEEVKAAHKKLMLLNHPDSGGSTYVCAKINNARELILLH